MPGLLVVRMRTYRIVHKTTHERDLRLSRMHTTQVAICRAGGNANKKFLEALIIQVQRRLDRVTGLGAFEQMGHLLDLNEESTGTSEVMMVDKSIAASVTATTRGKNRCRGLEILGKLLCRPRQGNRANHVSIQQTSGVSELFNVRDYRPVHDDQVLHRCIIRFKGSIYIVLPRPQRVREETT